ncbi:DUF6884 domain-containing protein [Streptomyces mangrovisoli]|uniref:DUF6884 domain-containing protein n=1 Tax=Streptomyces mangrovisoli TaxID=1428628 RepID=A0A1J4NP12_9ACTN|nr:DUF6884 domain-containing protein [Streptomyces mangrovisoli]OIJ63866.1 hypothetical protein WN71_031125 [Streptomyces mangrovisoli]
MNPHDHPGCFRPELVVIPCGSRKLSRPARAADMYVGSYHRACRRTAEALRPERLLILSARYGLVDLDDMIEPYDTAHGTARATTRERILRQARDRGIVRLDPVVALGGGRHTALIRGVSPHAHAPLAGAGSLGAQMARLAALREGRSGR